MRQAVESILPGFVKARVNNADSERVMVWRDEPWTRAAYSCPAPGQVTKVGPVLAAGIDAEGQAPLAFAGEHCYPAFLGYMEGAIHSGIAAAQQIARMTASRESADTATSALAW
jgi:monoamine oxidase